MKAMVMERILDIKDNPTPLVLKDVDLPVLAQGEILIEVKACGVCHTELDEIEGRTPPPVLPIIPGHQITGIVVQVKSKPSPFKVGSRVGAGWIYSSCGHCHFCRHGKENLCQGFKATGKDAHGGYAEYVKIHQAYAFPLPDSLSFIEAAPLFCAGAVGYRSLKLTGLGDFQNLGLAGFGASAHIVIQLVRHLYPHGRVYVFSRTQAEKDFAKEMGAVWAGDFGEKPPEKMDCMIDTTPVWKPVVDSLGHLKPGGRLVINAIGKEEIDKDHLQQLDYKQHLWLEKEVKSVANITRSDIVEFLRLAEVFQLKPESQVFHLIRANEALVELKMRKIRGAKVLSIGQEISTGG